MGRLTQKDEQGNWCLKGVAWEQLQEGKTITKEIYEKLYGALWKLMEYEDIGLTPEEIMDEVRMTRGDKIRSMTDEKLAEMIFANHMDTCIDFCTNKSECSNNEDLKIPEEKCKQCLIEWLRVQI